MTSDAATLRRHYDENGYAVLRAAAPPEVARGLLGLVTAAMQRPDVAARMKSHPTVNTKPSYEFHSSQFPAVYGFHWGMTSRLCDVIGKRLAPSYCFFRAYQQGDRCTVHSDRPACDHSVSLALGYADDIVWPIEVGRRRRPLEEANTMKIADDFGSEEYASIELNPGDALLYKGVNHRHGRITPNPNRWSAHLFLHWVDLDGPFAEWAFDKRPPPAPGDFQFTST
jgi:hypothetical protein